MSNRYRHPKWRLRLFNDDGMPEQLRKNLYWVIWSVTVGMLGFVVTHRSSMERLSTRGFSGPMIFNWV